MLREQSPYIATGGGIPEAALDVASTSPEADASEFDEHCQPLREPLHPLLFRNGSAVNSYLPQQWPYMSQVKPVFLL